MNKQEKQSIKEQRRAANKAKANAWLSKQHTYTNRKMAFIIIGTMVLSSIIFGQNSDTSTQKVVEKPVERVVTKEVTPQSCKDVITLDNKIFAMTSDALQNVFNSSKMDDLGNYITAETPMRTSNIADCFSK